MQKPESFEVTEYADPKKSYDKFSVIYQIIENKVRENPTFGCRVSFVGNMLKLYFHCYEMHLPVRMKEIEKLAHDSLNEAVKMIKKEFKTITKEKIELKEDKTKANYTVQKVSLNERYYVVYWRFFELQ